MPVDIIGKPGGSPERGGGASRPLSPTYPNIEHYLQGALKYQPPGCHSLANAIYRTSALVIAPKDETRRMFDVDSLILYTAQATDPNGYFLQPRCLDILYINPGLIRTRIEERARTLARFAKERGLASDSSVKLVIFLYWHLRRYLQT